MRTGVPDGHRAGGAGALLLVAAAVTTVVLLVHLLAPDGQRRAALEPSPDASRAEGAVVAGFSGVQLQNAALIIDAGVAAGVDRYGQTLAVMTAAGESSLRSLPYGDAAGPDSRGLFQQRDSWGTLDERLDPTTSARLFYRSLVQVPGWRQMRPTEAAHAVQRNADREHYTPYWDSARRIVDALAPPGA